MEQDCSLIHRQQGPTHTLTLNRPQVHNAFDDELIDLLQASLTKIDQDKDCRIVIINANGKNFCAGADLNWMRTMADNSFAENQADAAKLSTLLQTLAELNKPTICCVQGRVMGGGCGLVACSDIVLASTDASFCFSEVKLGLIPATIAPYIVRRLGYQATRRYFISAERISADTAKDIDLVDEVVTENLPAAAAKLAQQLLQNGPEAVSQAKKLVNDLCPVNEKVSAMTSNLLARVRASDEAKHGLKTFFAKQKPDWNK